ncbi:MAG: hypothetical protein SGJ02_06000 [bacterium]|nr:hypothetical protein [bacterium]
MPQLESSLVILRHLIDDTASVDYTDDRLTELLYISAMYVNLEIGTTYSINVCSQSIDPSPDDNFNMMVALKAACMLIRGTQKSYAQSDFTITDGPSSVSLKGIAGQLKISGDGFCGQYERAKIMFLMTGNYGGGLAITTPSSAC